MPSYPWRLSAATSALLVLGCQSGGERAALQRADSLAAALAQSEAKEKARAEQERVKPRALEVFSSTGITLPATQIWSTAFELSGGGSCFLKGRIETLSGGNKDVQVFVMTEDQFTNWKNNPNGNHTALFDGPRQTVTSVETPLTSPGSYRVVISNRWSNFTAKTVAGRAVVACQGGPQPRPVQGV